MTKRFYQLGEISVISSKLINGFLKGKKFMEKQEGGKFVYSAFYKEVCESVRRRFGFDFLIALGASSYNDEEVLVVVFEKEDDGKTYNWSFDKEKGLYYIELEEV